MTRKSFIAKTACYVAHVPSQGRAAVPHEQARGLLSRHVFGTCSARGEHVLDTLRRVQGIAVGLLHSTITCLLYNRGERQTAY